ncbi:MAG: hypothetical protein BKP49_02600 [Treponema sp. CETP13]|nr:MAG: hypothetical protein BKP49_02600 [Treponema sp. CETP13]
MNYVCLRPKFINRAVEFIKKNEHLCTGLSECLRWYKKKSEISLTVEQNSASLQSEYFFLLYNNNAIVGLVCLMTNGRILHHFEFSETAKKEDAVACTTQLLQEFYGEKSTYSLFCIAGLASNTAFLTNCVLKAKIAKIRQEENYNLMIYKPTYSECKKFAQIPTGVILHKCSIADLYILSDLQKLYYLEEVVPVGISFNEINGRKLLRRDLQRQIIFALYDKEKAKKNCKYPVAKAETNAIGFNWCQLGGIYTVKEFRNRGCATFLSLYIARTVYKKGYNTVLFVKKNNVPAIHAYKKAQFVNNAEFQIIYFI